MRTPSPRPRAALPLAVALLLLQSAALGAQGVRGSLREYQSERPISGGTVELLTEQGAATGVSTTTDTAGQFSLTAARNGMYRLRASGAGFRTAVSPGVELRAGEEVGLTLYLVADSIQLAPVIMNPDPPGGGRGGRGPGPRGRAPGGFAPRGAPPAPRGAPPREVAPRGAPPQEVAPRGMPPQGIAPRGVPPRAVGGFSGFNQRRESNSRGHFITRTDIDRLRPRRASEIFEGVPGLILVPSPTGFGYRVRTVEGCEPAVFVDGVRVSLASETLDEIVNPNDVEGVEVYTNPAEIPAEFGVFDECGAVFIWTNNGY